MSGPRCVPLRSKPTTRARRPSRDLAHCWVARDQQGNSSTPHGEATGLRTGPCSGWPIGIAGDPWTRARKVATPGPSSWSR